MLDAEGCCYERIDRNEQYFQIFSVFLNSHQSQTHLQTATNQHLG